VRHPAAADILNQHTLNESGLGGIHLGDDRGGGISTNGQPLLQLVQLVVDR
jgi:hypothetical protein